MKVIDFCAGAGGTSTGVLMSGAQVVLAVDNDPLALMTHGLAHPRVRRMEACIQDINPLDLPAHDVQTWSLPCQEFSCASGKSLDLATGALVPHFLRIVEATHPERLMFENVPRILKWRGFQDMRIALVSMGYFVSMEVVNAAGWDDQERERLVLFAHSRRWPTFPSPQHKPCCAKEILNPHAMGWQPLTKRVDKVRRNIEAARGKHGKEFLASGFANLAHARSLQRPIGTITTGRAWMHVKGDLVRYVDRAESARAQGFPAGYPFVGNEACVQRQIGNAFPVRTARAHFEALVQ